MAEARQNAKEVFLAAIEIPEPAERAAFLDKSCRGNDALRQRVEDLLRAYGQSGGSLEHLAAALAPTDVGQPLAEQAGTIIGPYKLMEQIGEGGFGLVFVAEQQQPIRRKVALKIIKPGMDTRDVIARFEAERQALALMDHPNIARVLDASTTESGRPYFVMELVRGVPITEYCDKHQLTPRERLELFVPVCNAIQHAHLKGIIHRDIKPSNVLVTLHDGKPVVKVIDFGVAKALHQPLTDRTVYTRFAQMIGTPLYMSPEQAEMSGLDIDTRTDVYSLGVLLYELLTGLTPFDKQRLAKAAYGEFLKIIREEEPPKLSLRLSQSSDSLPSIAALRKTEPAKLSKIFSGDLDWIAMKALDKDRTRRYETANAFAADVMRYLNDEPVEASPPSTAYRLRKFTRKHRRPVIIALAVMTVLLLGIAGTTWGLVRATKAEQIARTAENAAVGSERKARLALAEVAKERDAKVAERDRAERQLADGLLRSIGIASSEKLVESRSLADWSNIKDSRLKLRILEIAFENPEVAMRVARTAEGVVQACVGLSPTRRARALNLLSAKQRDTAADPRTRIAACWVALELGSQDIRPTLEPLFQDLKTSNYTNSQYFLIEALETLAGQLDPAQRTRVCDLMVESLGRPKDFFVGVVGLTKLAEYLNEVERARVCDILVAAIRTDASEISFGDSAFNKFNELMTALTARLSPEQAHRIGDAMVDKLHRHFEYLAGTEFEVSLPWLPTADRSRAANDMIAKFEESKNDAIRLKVLEILSKLEEPREPALAKRFAHALESSLAEVTQKAGRKQQRLRVEVLDELIVLSPELEPAQIGKLWDAVMALLIESADGNPISADEDNLTRLAARLESAQFKRSAELVISTLREPNAFGSVLTALAPRFDADQAARAWDSAREGPGHRMSLSNLTALAMRLESTKVDRAVEQLVQALLSSRWSNVGGGAGLNDRRLASLRRAARMKLPHERQLASAFVKTLEKGHPLDVAVTSTVVHELAPRLQPAEAKRIGNALLAAHRSIGVPQLELQIEVELAELAPRLEPSQVAQCADLMRTRLESGSVNGPCGRILRKLRAQLGTDLYDRLSSKAATNLLDRWTSADREYVTGSVDRPTPPDYEIVAALSSPKSVAKLLSHPGCVSERRELFLERLDELLFYGGKTVLLVCEDVGLKPDTPNAVPTGNGEGPRRRFRTSLEVAEWIQQNWPDFDLEASCPVIWRENPIKEQ